MKLFIRTLLFVSLSLALTSCGIINSVLGLTQRTVGSVTRTITGDADEEPYIEPTPGSNPFEASELPARELPAFTSESVVPAKRSSD